MNLKIRVLRGVNFPKAKKSHHYYVSMRLEEWNGSNRVQFKKIKTKTTRGSQLEWNEDFTIETRNPEKWFMTIKLKKVSKLSLKTTTVGSDVICVSELKVNQVNRLKLYDDCYYPVGKACDLDVEIKYLPDSQPRDHF